MKRVIFNLHVAVVMFFITAAAHGQVKSKTSTQVALQADTNFVRSSPAYSEVLLRRTELESDLESLLLDYTEDYPKIKETRFELSQIIKAADRLLAVKQAESGKLTLALGKLLVRQAALETELWKLQAQYKDGHPEVMRARKKVQIFEKAVNEILN
jgi:hypothetical protein